MSKYVLKVSPPAKKYLKKLSKQKALKSKFEAALHDILQDPYQAGELKSGDLAGVYGYDIYHAGTNYELAYVMEEDDEGNIVLLLMAGTRENFYEQLKRYWN